MDDVEILTNKTLAEKHLRKFGSFLESHSLELNQLVNEEDKDDGLKYPEYFPTVHHIWEGTSPIALSWTPVGSQIGLEEIISIPLPPEGNPDVQKVLLVLGNLSLQFNNLREQGNVVFITPLLLYGEGYEQDVERNFNNSSLSASVYEGDGHIAMARFIPKMQQLVQFLKLGKSLCSHWFEQIVTLFKDSKPNVVFISTLQLPSVFRAFGDFLSLFIVIDEVIGCQTILKEHWTRYRQMIGSVQADSESFGADAEHLLKLERELFIIDKELMSGNIFKNAVNEIKSGVKLNGKGANLLDKFNHFLIQLAQGLEKDFLEGNDELKPLTLAATFVFASAVFSTTTDWKKFFQKNLLEPLKKIPAVPIGSSVLWVPELFLNSFTFNGGKGKLFDAKSLQLYSNNRQTYLQQKTSSLPKDVVNTSLLVSSWSIRLQEVFYSKPLNQLALDDLSKRCNLILQGLKCAQSISQNFKMILGLHALIGKPISKQIVILLCHLLELLKQVQCTFFRFSVQIANSSIYIVQHILHTALSHLKTVQKLLASPEFKKMDEMRADALSVLKIFENSLRGPTTEKRLLVARMTLDWALSSSKFWKGEDAALILPAAVERTSSLVGLYQSINVLCNGSELFWHRIILSTYFSSVYVNEMEAEKLPLMFMIIGDCFRFLDNSPHGDQVKKSFIAEMDGYIKYNLMDKMCQDIETDLRLLAHSHLQVTASDDSSPFKAGVKEHQYLLACPSLSFETEKALNFKLTAEYYLSKTFYNLASVALHDWQSYATMRVLAYEKYGLEIMDDNLPGHSLEQGRDVLEIVRNLPQFVQEFLYNLNNQVFVQLKSQNKHLDTVNIRHLANSMRTHGIGMINTTVNSAYQYLIPKIQIFSQHLYHEQIRSRLTKDIRIFKQTRQDSSIPSSSASQQSNFPFKAAEKFKKGIKKLGLLDGLTWLEHFRILITHVGNALGFVRLVRSGGLHYLAGGCRFIPDIEDISGFAGGLKNELANESQMDEKAFVELQGAISLVGLDGLTVETKSLNNLQGVGDYFNILVEAFKGVCTMERNAHLKSFYIVIPALTLSYVDHIIQCKEQLAKKSKFATVFTNDGFPMGVAYLLQVLAQDEEFDSLGWFNSVKQHYEEEKRKESKIITESKNDEKLEQASQLTAKRLHNQLQEFELLRYNLSSARIFFQRNEQSKK